MFRLDYLSCALTILSTILIGRKKWAGFVVAGVNSLIIGYIGFKTHQIGFIPANIFCIVIYGFSIRWWMRESRMGKWLEDTRIAEAEDLAASRLPGQNPGSGSIASGKGARIIPFPIGRVQRNQGRIVNR